MTTELMILAQIREAVGDPKGKLMQDELLARVRAIVAASTRMREALNESARLFRHYEAHHRAKASEAVFDNERLNRILKAELNAAAAKKCEEALKL